jgi:hypothetical protein
LDRLLTIAAGFLLPRARLPQRQVRNQRGIFQNLIFGRENRAKIAIFRQIAVKRFR